MVVTATRENEGPVADAGVDQEVFVGEEVVLDGSGSRDADGDTLHFQWRTVVVPEAVELSDPKAASPTFTPSVPGRYEFALVVSDGFEKSESARVRVDVIGVEVPGDVNANGIVEVQDAFLVLRMAIQLPLFTTPAGHVEPTSYEKAAADVNEDGEITLADALLIVRLVLDRIAKPVPLEGAGGEVLVRWGAAVREGNVLRVPLIVEEREDLGAGSVRIRYNPAVLEPLEVRAGAAEGLIQVNIEPEGQIQAALVRPGGIVGPEGSVLDIRFKMKDEVLKEGQVVLEAAELFDGNAAPVVVLGAGQVAELRSRPHAYALAQNIPNPFNPSTQIRFELPQAGPVRLVVYDLLGQEVKVLAEARMEAGHHAVTWDGMDNLGRPAGSGVYLLRLEAGGSAPVRKMTLMR